MLSSSNDLVYMSSYIYFFTHTRKYTPHLKVKTDFIYFYFVENLVVVTCIRIDGSKFIKIT